MHLAVQRHSLALLLVLALTNGVLAIGAGLLVSRSTEQSRPRDGLSRFAEVTFGDAGRAALDQRASGEGTPPGATPFFTEYRTPNGWLLRPAGVQIDTQRAPTGVAVSPDNLTVVAVTSGIFDEQITAVDAVSLASMNEFTTDLYLGAAMDGDNNLWVSTGSRNRIYQYQIEHAPDGRPVLRCVRCSRVVPGSPESGLTEHGFLPSIPVIAYPGSMALSSDLLYVAGNLSVPSSYIDNRTAAPGPTCADSSICSVVSVVDIANPFAPSPSVRFIPVGRDAFGLVLNEGGGKLYVTNWADETNPARGRGRGTVSVVDLATEKEVQVFPVGRHPTGIALGPDGRSLFVANSADDSLSNLTLRSDGLIASSSTIDLRTTADAPRAAAPLGLGFSADGSYLLVALAGQNAIEVRTAAGKAIARSVQVTIPAETAATGRPVSSLRCAGSGGEGAERPQCATQTLRIPHTYIPTGWFPSALTASPHPNDSSKGRLYVTDLKGVGAGPGHNAQASTLMGSRTQGILQVIDLPADAEAQAALFDQWTATVVENNNWAPIFNTRIRDAAADPCLPAPVGSETTFSRFLCEESKKQGRSPYHVVYIVKENKTFDVFFGDINALGLPDADADPAFLLFGETGGTKNQHNLARLFTIGDDFWADSEQSTTGHSWTSAGYATEFIEITWNPEYSQGFRGNRGSGQYEGQFSGPGDPEIAEQEGELNEPEERLVDLMADTKINRRKADFRIYSSDVNDESEARRWMFPLGHWGLGGRAEAIHGGGDLDFPDTDRAKMFLYGHTVSQAWTACGIPCTSAPSPPPASYQKEIGICGAPDDPEIPNAPRTFCERPGSSDSEYGDFALDAWTAQYQQCIATGKRDDECQSAMPNFLYMALPVDHTLGFHPFSLTPQSMVADNDYATGLIVDALSKSPFWKNTLILITEDDTQLAGDHVDAHRTFLLSAGGLSRRHGPQGRAAHQPASFPSVLKTAEVLFGLPPLTIYDRAAVPLHDFVVNSLGDRNTVVYDVADPGIPFARNPATGTLAELSLMVDWRLDMGDPDLVTALMYHGIRGWPLPDKYLDLLEK